MIIPDSIYTMYSKDVNFERAVVQLQMLPDVVKTYKESQGLRKLEVTCVRTIAEVLNGIPMTKQMFSEVDKLLHLYFTYLSQHELLKEASLVFDASRPTSDQA